MRITELLRLVWLNINQNKFKSILTSIGIVVGAATIVLVIGIGRGGQMEVAEQFAELNAGAIDVSYDYEGEEEKSGGRFSFGNMGAFFGNMFGGFGRGQNAGTGNAASGEAGASTNVMPGGSADGGMPAPGNALPGSGGTDGGVSTPENVAPGGSDADGDAAAPGNFTPGGDGEMQGNAAPGGDGEMQENAAAGGNDGASGNAASGDMPEDFAAGGNDGVSGNAAPEGLPGDSGDNIQDSASGKEDAENDGGGRSRSWENGKQEAQADDQEDDDGEEESETSMVDDRLNQEKITLTQEDVEDIERYVSGIDGATISYSTRASVEGGNLSSAQTYTIAGVKEAYLEVSKLEMAQGEFLTEENDQAKERVCVLGATVAKELFGSEADALGGTIYIDDRTYTVSGVLKSSQTVSAGISPDTAVMIPYETGIKYITGTDIDPTLTVIAHDVDSLQSVIEDVRTVLEESYENTRFTFEDSGSKMQAAQSSNRILTMLLSAMAAIVFLVGGIGIMNVLFVSVKERTNEIGILKAIGTPRGNILTEFLVESAAISLIGGVLGVALSFGVIPVAEWLDVRVEVDLSACLIALGFAVLTGTIFGIYPAWKASRLEPVDALNAE